jgi:hypothetical protein
MQRVTLALLRYFATSLLRYFATSLLQAMNNLMDGDAGYYPAIQRGVRVRSSDLQAFLCQIEAYADPWARQYVAAALAGDINAAGALSVALSNAKRGNVAVAFWRAGAPREAFRELLGAVWGHDHRELIVAAGTRRRLHALFRYAQFDTSHLPDVIQVWRGAAGLGFTRTASGYAWTTERDIACWFAMRRATYFGDPIVLTAHIPREVVAFYTDERHEKEVVMFDPPVSFIDKNVDDWRARFEFHEQVIRERNKRLSASTVDE